MVGATIEAFDEADPDGDALAMSTSDAQGNYSLAIPTGTTPIAAFVRATAENLKTTEVFFPEVLTADQPSPILMFDPGTLSLLGTFAGQTQLAENAVAVVLVIDCDQQPVIGATVTPPSGTVVYGGANGQPDSSAVATSESGVAFVFNVTPGTDLVFDAEVGGTSFRDNTVRAVADTVVSLAIAP